MIRAFVNMETRTHRPGETRAILSSRREDFTLHDVHGKEYVDEYFLQERTVAAVLEDPDLARHGYTREHVAVLHCSFTYEP